MNIKGMDMNIWTKHKNNIFVGRPSKWGNPFRISDMPRALCVAKYIDHVLNSELANDLGELKSMNLGCVCAPHLCHAHALVMLYNRYELSSSH